MTAIAVPHDAIYPRDENHRLRLYALERDGSHVVRATAPDAEAVGVALITLGRERAEAGEPPEILAVYDAVERRWLSTLWAGRG